MTEIRKSKPVSSWNVLVIEYSNLGFICNLVLGICVFRHKTTTQSHIFLTLPGGLDFLNRIKTAP